MTAVYVNINGELRDQSLIDIPSDREFRSAWQFSGAAVEVDMTKAKDIQRGKLRAERAAKFSELDSEWFRADEDADAAKKAEVAAKKKALRDVTEHQKIAKAKTPDELKGLTLAALVGDK
jgi:hypothetical protein